MRLTVPVFLLSAALAVPVSAQFTGTWQGTYSGCGSSGNIALELTQTGSTVRGVMTIDVGASNCWSAVAGSYYATVSAGLSGQGSISGGMSFPQANGYFAAGGPFAASLNGSTMSIMSRQPNNPSKLMTATLTRSSEAAPLSDQSGTYSGTYKIGGQVSSSCSLEFSGPVGGTLMRAGNKLAGTLKVQKNQWLDDPKKCTLKPVPDADVVVSAQINGSAVSGTLWFPSNDPPYPNQSNAFTATLDNMAFDATVSAGGAHATFSLSGSLFETPPSPVIESFTANPSTISSGGSSTLSWSTTGAGFVTIDPALGTQATSGSVPVSPSSTTTYTLNAVGEGGYASAKATVTVLPPGSPASVFVSLFPEGMIAAAGAPAADRFVVANLGGSTTAVTLTASDSFFTVSPASFTLNGNSSQVVSVNAAPQAAGNYSGTATVSGGGISGVLSVPIRLLVTAAAGTNVTASAARIDLAAPAGTNPGGSIAYTNGGSAPVEGLLAADVPWIVIPNPVLSLAPGTTASVVFSVDRTTRGDAQVGGAAGTLTFRYLGGNIRTALYDTVTVAPSPLSPWPVASGEPALFVAGASPAGDLALSNGGTSTLTDLKLLFSPAGGSGSQAVSLSPFPAGATIALPNAVKTLFGASQGGTLQIRSSKNADVAVSFVSIGAESHLTALPIFRSDRGSQPGSFFLLPGVRKETTIVVQEVAGKPASVKLDFYDANGNQLATRSESVNEFGTLQLLDAVPAGAACVVVWNDASSAGSIDGYALVIDGTSHDAFAVMHVEPPAGTLFVPLFAAASAGNELLLNLTNQSDAPIDIGVSTVAGPARRHVVGHAIAPAASNVVTLPRWATQQLPLPNGGFVRLSGPQAMRASALIRASRNGGAIGSGAPALPGNGALHLHARQRFTGIEESRAYATNLLVVETSGSPATVRFTLVATLWGGRSVVAQKDVTVAANSYTLVPSLAQTILGEQRSAFGDLHSVVLDVEVIGGAGAVLPFIEMVDTATGEITVRHQ